MAHWLLKSEPHAYSIDDLSREGVAPWEGVRNYAARNNLRAMRAGDLAFFYHSAARPPGIAGICEVVREAYPDHFAWDPSSRYFDRRSSADDPRWFMVDVRFVEKLARFVPIEELRRTPGLQDMALLRYGRLSVQPVADAEWAIVLDLARRG